MFGDKASGGGEPPTLLYHTGHLVPVEVHVQSEAHPAPRADVGRDEEPVRLLFHQFGLYPGSRLEPEVGSPVGRTFVEVADIEATSSAASCVEMAMYLATEPNPGEQSVNGRSLSIVLGIPITAIFNPRFCISLKIILFSCLFFMSFLVQIMCFMPVSYTHLTLPTNREV